MSLRGVLVLVMVAVTAAHYGDPYRHQCEQDEQPIGIQGLSGEFCSPPCNGTVCPTDLPAGATATPTCALTSPSGDKYCALVCNPSSTDDAQCGTDASCKPIQGTGLCTYDDAPAPPSTAHWKPIISPTFAEISEAIGVGFAPDGKTGYCGGGENGVGVEIYKTVDAGVTWKSVWPDNSTKQKFNLFLASAAKSPKEAIVTGVLFQAYTTTGETFSDSKDDFLDPAQDAGITPDGKFAIINSGGKAGNGPATSVTGKIWQVHDLGVNVSYWPARYGSYPSAKTWYVTAGNFPTEDTVEGARRLTHRIQVGPLKIKTESSNDDPVDCSVDPANCFSAGIFKTTDGGATFTQVYTDINKGSNIYPNGIHCATENTCMAVVEGDTCRILLTTDGGKTWTETMKDTDAACSLTYAHMLSEKEAWVAGGHMTALDFEGRFWHTVDAGQTWVKEKVMGLYIFDLDFVSPTSAFALGLSKSGAGVSLYSYDSKGQSPLTFASKFAVEA